MKLKEYYRGLNFYKYDAFVYENGVRCKIVAILDSLHLPKEKQKEGQMVVVLKPLNNGKQFHKYLFENYEIDIKIAA